MYTLMEITNKMNDIEKSNEIVETLSLDELISAHFYSNNHMERLKASKKCGCFFCLNIFDPSEITEWLFADNLCDKYGTAFCPHCGIDSVIGDSSGYPITRRFLHGMRKYSLMG